MKNYKSDNKSNSGGMGFLSVLQLIFIVLKLLHLIDWKWAIVLIPTWIGLGIVGIFLIFMLGMYWLHKL